MTQPTLTSEQQAAFDAWWRETTWPNTLKDIAKTAFVAGANWQASQQWGGLADETPPPGKPDFEDGIVK